MSSELETLGIRKVYPGTVALDDLSVRFDGGRVHALLGKNGAGKSTLVKILSGTTRPTAGRILVSGREVTLASPRDATSRGIATVHQELSLVPGLTVAENVLLGRLPLCGGVWVDWPRAYAEARAVLDEMHVDVDVRREVRDLGVAQQQLVEIAKAMVLRPAALLLDEPTSALARHHCEALFALMRRLAASGVAVVYITHRLAELKDVADTITVLRDGRLAGTMQAAGATPEAIVRMMFGEDLPAPEPAPAPATSRTVLEVRGLGRRGRFHDVSFRLLEGEVLGLAGMVGSGRTELLRAIFGADRADAGEILLDGRPITARDPSHMRAAGVAFTPENRKEHALVQDASIRSNICMASWDSIARHGVVTRRTEGEICARVVADLGIKAPDIELPVSTLSGGNQQKVVIGKWAGIAPRVMLLDEPTRGVDVHAKQHIFRIVRDLARRGIGCLVVSSELEELLEVCHRVLVMRAGTLAGDMPVAGLTVDALFARCMEA